MSEKQRFGGISRLYSGEGLDKLSASHVCVIGVGGVGAWSAEALARSGVGKITLIDLDDVCTTNINRQIHALDDTVGQPKVEVLATRIAGINPQCQVHAIEDFVTADNVRDLITEDMSSVIEATDSVKAKAAIIAHCKRIKCHVVTG